MSKIVGVSEIGHHVFLYGLALITSLFMAELFRRKDQSEVIGQVLVGVLLGPYVLGILYPNEFFSFISEIGALTLLFIAGLETDVKMLIKSGPAALVLAVSGLALTILLSFPIVYFFSGSIIIAIFVSITLGATSISLTVRIFDEMGKLRTPLAQMIIISAVFDDLIVMILAVFVLDIAHLGTSTINSLIYTLSSIAVFFAITIGFMIVFVKYIDAYLQRFYSRGALLIFAFSFALLYGYFASLMGFSPIIGAYFAGVIVAESDIEHEVIEGISPLAFVTVPIFLVNIGLKFNLSIIGEAMVFGGLLSAAAIFGKLLSGFPANKMRKGTRTEGIILGASMMPRAEVVLIFAGIGLEMGIINDLWFSSLVLVMMTTTFLTPIILKYLLTRGDIKYGEAD